jgi:hypothetical protein
MLRQRTLASALKHPISRRSLLKAADALSSLI